MNDAINNLRTALCRSLIERDAEIEAMLRGLVAREHVLLVGPPGTAKSQLATNLTHAIEEADAFPVLLTKFTTPEELFGPVKLTALREDRYERAIAGYAPTAHVLFVDEIWKASSAILNTLLTLLQERVFDNGGRRIRCPLRLAIAASNEWPSAEDGQELGAIFDRFLIRRVVRPVSPMNRDRLLYTELPAVGPADGLEGPVVELDEIDAAADQAAQLPVSDDAREAYGDILDALAGEGIRPGDRRIRKAVGIARAQAWLNGHSAVERLDLECLSDVLWSTPEHVERAVEIISKIANPVGAALSELLAEVDEISAEASSDDPAQQMSAIKKLGECAQRANELANSAGGNGRAREIHRHVRNERIRLQAKALGISEEKAAKFLASHEEAPA